MEDDRVDHPKLTIEKNATSCIKQVGSVLALVGQTVLQPPSGGGGHHA